LVIFAEKILNTPLFIARRINSAKQGRSFTGLIKAISRSSITLGLAVMIIAIAVVTGFQKEISDKVIGFGSHIQIVNFDYNVSFEPSPVDIESLSIEELKSISGVRHVQRFATKPGIMKTDDENHGVVMKGVYTDFDWSFFSSRLVEGTVMEISDTLRSNQILVSRFMANLLGLEVNDRILVYFLHEPIAIRAFNISGIYETGLEELDRIFIIGDLRHIQRINNWTEGQVGGFEVLVNDFGKVSSTNLDILDILPFHLDARAISDIYPQIFDWLAMLDMNVYVILFLMALVGVINMITTLLISVLEKTNMIGILKAIGASNFLVRKVFLYNASFTIARGLLWGNIIGISLCLLQYHFGIIKLPQESYYVSVVPINLQVWHVVAVNLGTFFICLLMLILPSVIVSRISPVKAITFR